MIPIPVLIAVDIVYVVTTAIPIFAELSACSYRLGTPYLNVLKFSSLSSIHAALDYVVNEKAYSQKMELPHRGSRTRARPCMQAVQERNQIAQFLRELACMGCLNHAVLIQGETENHAVSWNLNVIATNAVRYRLFVQK